jgi:exonuclease V gamma subunit
LGSSSKAIRVKLLSKFQTLLDFEEAHSEVLQVLYIPGIMQQLTMLRHGLSQLDITAWILDYDVRKAFDKVNRHRLKNIFLSHINEPGLWKEIEKMLNAGILDPSLIFEDKGVQIFSSCGLRTMKSGSLSYII